jgi:hypothetical protein
MSRAQHEARGGRRGIYIVLVGNLREIDHLDDLGVNGRIILRLIFMNWDLGVRDRDIWRVLVNAVMGPMKCGEFID